MLDEELHPSDQELLQAADGELPPPRAVQIHAHLAACWECRARMAEIEGTIADFVRAHRHTLDPQLPPIAGPRALLRARLAELASRPHGGSWRGLFRFTSVAHAAALLGVAVLVAAAIGGLLVPHFTLGRRDSAVVSPERESEPDHSLTPGATRSVAIGD